MRTKIIFASCLAVLFATATVGAQCVAPMPLGITEGWEAMGQGSTSTLGCGSPPAPTAVLPAGWTHGDLPLPYPPPLPGGAATNWFRSDSGGTPSGNTGPNTDVTLGTSAGIYLYLETSGGCGSSIAYLNAPPFDATGVAAPVVEFWYHMRGTSMGTLRVDVFDGASWVPAFTVNGDQGNVWHFVQVPLTTFNTGASQQCLSEILFRFTGIGGGGFTSDMAIDEVRFGDATPAAWDTNTSLASTTIDSASGGAFFPTILTKSATVTPCTSIPAVGSAEISTTNNPGAIFDVAISPDPIVGLGTPGSLALGGGAILNLNLANFLSWTFMNGPTLTLAPFPGSTFPGWSGGTVNVPFAITTAPQTVSVQSVITTPGAGAGFELTQATQLDVLSASDAQGPNGDETSVALDVVNQPFCWTTAGVPFYGTLYTTVFIQSNGRLRFDVGTTDFTPTLLTAATNVMFGLWADLDTSPGTVTASSPAAGVVRVDYTNVAYFGGGPTNTFAYELDSNTGVLTIDGLSGVDTVNPPASDVFLGLSPGNNALDPGAAIFVAGAPLVINPGATIMTYDFGVGVLPASIAAGATSPPNQILFVPNGGGVTGGNGYDYQAF